MADRTPRCRPRCAGRWNCSPIRRRTPMSARAISICWAPDRSRTPRCRRAPEPRRYLPRRSGDALRQYPSRDAQAAHRVPAAHRVAKHPAGRHRLARRLGPGSVTASLARAAGPDGLALGVDISEPMLARAVSAQAGPQIGFLRADAQRLPLREETVDAVVSVAVLQLIPDPVAALAEMARVLRPGGRLAVMAPTAGRAARLLRILPNTGVHLFGEDELGDIHEGHGLIGVRTKSLGTIQWVRAKRG